MEKQNIREYELLRGEMVSLKDCITRYMGFVLGGSGAVFFGLGAIPRSSDYRIAFAYITLSISIVISLIVLILFYKFNSHNRYAGYCKLLNQERFRLPENTEIKGDFMSWEICMDRIRASDLNNAEIMKTCNTLSIENLSREEVLEKMELYSGLHAAADRHKYSSGASLIKGALEGDVGIRSWRFPLFIVLVLLCLLAIYMVLAFGFCIAVVLSDEPAYGWGAKSILLLSCVPVAYLQYRLWKVYVGKLHCLMLGSNTVDAFCWKFLPFRYRYVKEINPLIRYSLTDMKD